MNDARTIICRIAQLFDNEGTRYENLHDGELLRTGDRGAFAQYSILISATEDAASVFIVVRMPFRVPERQRTDVAETIVRINYGRVLGRFELDMGTGDLNYFAAIPLVDSSLTDNQFRTVMAFCLHSVEHYHRAFGRLLFDDELSPIEVVAEVEMGELAPRNGSATP